MLIFLLGGFDPTLVSDAYQEGVDWAIAVGLGVMALTAAVMLIATVIVFAKSR